MADLFWLSDAQWAVIEPFMPRNQPGPEREDDRRIISDRRTPGRPSISTRAWISVVWPPRERPMACAVAPLFPPCAERCALT